MIEELLVSLAVRRQPVAALIFGDRPAGAIACNAIALAVKQSQRGKLALHRGDEGIALALRFADNRYPGSGRRLVLRASGDDLDMGTLLGTGRHVLRAALAENGVVEDRSAHHHNEHAG